MKPRLFYKTLKKLKAFTLIELIIVIVILGILVAVAIPKYKDMRFEAKQSSTYSSLSNLRSATNIYVAKRAQHDPPVIGLDGQMCSVCNGGADPDDTAQEVNFFPLFIPKVPQNEIASDFVAVTTHDTKIMVYTNSALINSTSLWIGNSSCGPGRANPGKIDEVTGWVFAVVPYGGISDGTSEGYDWRINIEDCVKGGTIGYYDK